MGRVFAEDSPSLDPNNVQESIEKIERWLRYTQERIEHMNYSQGKIDERQSEEIGLVVQRAGTSVSINDTNIVTQAQRVTDNETYTSSITQNYNSINSIVQAVGANGTVTAASIVQAVNNAGSTVKISADHITLSGDVVLKSNLTDGSTQISGSNITTGTINAQNVNVTNINGQNVVSAVANASNAAVANALNTALSGFASQMMTYITYATATATDYSGGLRIGSETTGVKMYAYNGTFTVQSISDSTSITLIPAGQSVQKWQSSTWITVFILIQRSSNELYGIGLEGSTPTFTRLSSD